MTDDARLTQSAEARLRFLLDLGDSLREAETPAEVARRAVRALGPALGLSGAGYGEIADDKSHLRIEASWSEGTAPSRSEVIALSSLFCAHAIDQLRAGKVIALSGHAPEEDEPLDALVAAPVLLDGALAAVLYGHASAPRAWEGPEVDLVKDVAPRTWSAHRQAAAEISLKESEERLRDITDALPVLISYIDEDQRLRFVNRAYAEWFERPLEDIVGRKVAEIMPAEAYEFRRPYLERALCGEELSFEADLPLPRGTIASEVRLRPQRNAEGRTVGVYTLVLDITERKLSENSLRQSEMRFRQFAEQSPAMIWSCDRNGLLTYLSDKWYAYTGLHPDTPLAEGWDEVIHPEDLNRVKDGWQQALVNADAYDVEARLRRYDGVYRWHSIRAEPFWNYDGNLTGWLGTNSDIEDAVAESEERKRDLDRLWRISQEVMVIRDLTGRIVSANPSASRLLGWRNDELVGRSIYELIHPDDLETTRRIVADQLADDGTLSLRNRYLCKDGSYRIIDWRGVLHDDYVHSVGRDVTAELQAAEELRRAEEALRQSQKMEAVGRLTGGIAHDFNNMLAGVIGSLNLLQRRIEKGRYEETTRFIEAAQASAQRAASLTQRLLAFGRRQPLDVRPVDVAELTRSLEELLRRTIGPSISLQIELEDFLWQVQADFNQLESAILNLAINARDAMPNGGTLRLGARNARGYRPGSGVAGDYVEIYVADTGQGMPPEVLRQAFEPFFTTKPIGQGTGLGLSMVYGFVTQIGGDAKIESAPGDGTVVRLFLPRSLKSVARGAADIRSPAPAGRQERVLLVEDDETLRMLIMDALEELGYHGEPVADATAAVQMLDEGGSVDLLITDVGLPGMSGRELAALARSRRPDLPVLFITGYAEVAVTRDDFLEPGMHLLTKPFGIDQLANRISEIFRPER